jgi:hypothetical protein
MWSVCCGWWIRPTLAAQLAMLMLAAQLRSLLRKVLPVVEVYRRDVS